jgi:Na+-transporting methylmalonyl-CoA/oxaloacetate decarboxylase gamma subunit
MMTQTLLVNAQLVFDGSQRGISIAVAGLLIVFTALLLISLFIASLPRLLEIFARAWPEVDEHHHWESHPESFLPENDAVLAAIGFVLHTELQKQLKADEASADKN